MVLGSSNTDLVIRGPRLPHPGETILEGEFYRAAGGKGANQAVAAARASRGKVTFIAAVGDDVFGREAIESIRAERIDTRFVKTVAGRASGVALILVDRRGENMISVASGANLELTPDDVDRVPDERFEQAAVFLASLEIPWETVVRGLERARRFGLITILNPAPAREEIARERWMRLVDVITPNEGEAAMLVGADPGEPATSHASARRLVELGCGACIVTLGARGCLILDHVATTLPARPVTAIDATAAGDAFSGALAAALAEGRALAEAAAWAGTAAAISVTRQGAQPSLPWREEIERTYAA